MQDLNYTRDEFRTFLKKYNVLELQSLDVLLYYSSFDYDVSIINQVKDEVIREKIINNEGDLDDFLKYKKFTLVKLQERDLNYKELCLLRDLTDSTAMCLDSLDDKERVEREIIQVDNLYNALDEKIKAQESKEVKKIKLNLKKKDM